MLDNYLNVSVSEFAGLVIQEEKNIGIEEKYKRDYLRDAKSVLNGKNFEIGNPRLYMIWRNSEGRCLARTGTQVMKLIGGRDNFLEDISGGHEFARKNMEKIVVEPIESDKKNASIVGTGYSIKKTDSRIEATIMLRGQRGTNKYAWEVAI